MQAGEHGIDGQVQPVGIVGVDFAANLVERLGMIARKRMPLGRRKVIRVALNCSAEGQGSAVVSLRVGVERIHIRKRISRHRCGQQPLHHRRIPLLL